ncbi:hypothetical protein Pan189_35020 [Stratiformator vulcanicus]|uniref:Uncharacterized protein n=1 Tax=Stratiformator vulcanicus TaxID=2527980 RepID=A0A517R5H2_9PLAN|nr:hypothetical protein Pan189_35020 [Stratiformator vulcanicus]
MDFDHLRKIFLPVVICGFTVFLPGVHQANAQTIQLLEAEQTPAEKRLTESFTRTYLAAVGKVETAFANFTCTRACY